MFKGHGSGNSTFLRLAYNFYRELFWDGIRGHMWDYAYDSVLCLNKMASVLGQEEDAVHWNQTVGMEDLQRYLENRWNSSAHLFGRYDKGVAFGNIAPAANSQFPRDWVVEMAEHWMDDSEKEGSLDRVCKAGLAGQRLCNHPRSQLVHDPPALHPLGGPTRKQVHTGTLEEV